MSRWRITNIILIVLFISMAIFLWLRPYDGTGTTNTMNVKLISLAVLIIFFAFIGLIELIVYLFVRK